MPTIFHSHRLRLPFGLENHFQANFYQNLRVGKTNKMLEPSLDFSEGGLFAGVRPRQRAPALGRDMFQGPREQRSCPKACVKTSVNFW